MSSTSRSASKARCFGSWVFAAMASISAREVGVAADRGGAVVERGHDARDLVPALEAGGLHVAQPAEAGRRADRRLGRLRACGVEGQIGPPAVPSLLRFAEALGGAVLDGRPRRPGQPHAIAAGDPGKAQPLHVVGAASGDGIAAGVRPRGVQDVAHLQALDLLGGAHATVQHGLLQLLLAAQDQHLLTLGQKVDGLAVPDEPQAVHRHRLVRGIPGHAERRQRRQPLGLKHLPDTAVVIGVALRGQAALVVVEEGLDGRRALGRRRLGDIGHLDPFGRRAEVGLGRGQRRGGNQGRDGEAGGETGETHGGSDPSRTRCPR